MSDAQIEARINRLKKHLKEENSILYEVVESFRELDMVAYKLGFLAPDQSYVTRFSWWPMISILGLYSSGKSTFINYYLQKKVQRTGNQAVDDKFTVICFSGDDMVKTLPGIALDADPRFPFYQISHEIKAIAEKTGHKADSYLQLKTCSSEQVRGQIIIDSPGFDADKQRTSTLHVNQHIINLSDLVLIFFDARHPEPGAMRDTLKHLVSNTIERQDSNKFLYILNQMDITARDDNPEEVVASWQRSLAHAGLTSGRFYRIYNPDVALPIEEPQVRERIDKKCQADMQEIKERMQQVGIERAYRVISILENTANNIKHQVVPRLQTFIQDWKTKTFIADTILGVILFIAGFFWFSATGIDLADINISSQSPTKLGIWGGVIISIALFLHIKICRWTADKVIKGIKADDDLDEYMREGLTHAFNKNITTFRSIFILFIHEPAGWGNRSLKQLNNALISVNDYIQKLNDRFTNPSGRETNVETSSETKE